MSTESNSDTAASVKTNTDNSNQDLFLQLFDDIGIEDEQIYELSKKTDQYSPYQLLLEYIKQLILINS